MLLRPFKSICFSVGSAKATVESQYEDIVAVGNGIAYIFGVIGVNMLHFSFAKGSNHIKFCGGGNVLTLKQTKTTSACTSSLTADFSKA